MKEKVAKTDVGIIVARFHTHKLHEAHRDLIQSVIEKHDRVIIFLGLSPLKNTLNNPLEFRHRKAMIEELYKNVDVHYIDDNRDNGIWSKNLDQQIRKWLGPTQSATLYGSRDSFLKLYSGKYPTCELESEIFISASEIRRRIINGYPPSEDFRAGLIAATGLHFPTAYQTVDGAVVKSATKEILLVRKPGETQWRLIGGFSDPNSESLEMDVRREIAEETGVETGAPIYIGSTLIDDWRYKNEINKIKTALFVAEYSYGTPVGADDVEAAKWFKFADLNETNVVPEHLVLIKLLKDRYFDGKPVNV